MARIISPFIFRNNDLYRNCTKGKEVRMSWFRVLWSILLEQLRTSIILNRSPMPKIHLILMMWLGKARVCLNGGFSTKSGVLEKCIGLFHHSLLLVWFCSSIIVMILLLGHQLPGKTSHYKECGKILQLFFIRQVCLQKSGDSLLKWWVPRW